jgi:hypothetical protein
MPQLEDFFRLGASRAELARLNNFNAFHPSRAERMANGKAQLFDEDLLTIEEGLRELDDPAVPHAS